MEMTVSRLLLATAVAASATCATAPASPMPMTSAHQQGLLSAAPKADVAAAASGPGVHPLELGARRDGVLFVPKSYSAGKPVPLIVAFHGAGGDAQQGLDILQTVAEERGVLLLSIDSRGPSWDVIRGGLGPDVAFVDAALAKVFSAYRVDPAHVAVAGFSDGASYALTLGLSNGGLFTHVLAFSPGFAAPLAVRGKPRIYISHGTRDAVLPIAGCGRRLARVLGQDYDVTYDEFDGPHTVPRAQLQAAMKLFL